MLQRSKRVLVTTVGSTPEQVGPGSYELPKEERLYETPWRLKGVPYGGLNRTEKRFNYLELKMSKNDNPSPSSYEISRFGDKSRQKVPTASFASTTQRFRCKQTDYPTPGKYEHKSDFAELKAKSKTDSPFMTSAARFAGTHLLDRNAHLGPNTYEMGNLSLADQSQREAEYKQTLKGAFGTNCARKLKLISSNSVGWTWTDSPGPGSYRSRVNARPISVFGNSVFTSRSNRMEKEPKDKKNYPAPSDYSVRNYCISKDIRDEDMISGKMKKYSKRHKNERYSTYPPINTNNAQRKPVVHVVKYEPGGRVNRKKNTNHIYCNTNVS